MKLIYALLLIPVFLAPGCTKSAVGVNPSRLQGKWKLTQSYSSDGSAALWQPVPQKADYDYVQFDANGHLEGTVYTAYQNYAVTDSVTLTFSKVDTLEHYHYTLQAGTLTLSPSGPVFCFEGCGNRFIKVSD